LGRKSRKKQIARTTITADRAKENRRWKIIGNSIMLPSGALAIWSFVLLDQTFVKTTLILIPSLIAGLIATAILYYLWRNHKVPLWVLLLFGMLSGGSATSFLLSATNYYLRDHSTTRVQLDIIDAGNRSGRKSACKTPFAVVVYDDIVKELPFPCDYERVISLFTKVNLKISKGLLGFYVIEQKKLLK
jgi:hypothetical protein